MLTLEAARPLLSGTARDALHDYDPVAAIADAIDPKALSGRHPLDKAQYTWIKTMLEGQILNWGGDRVDMAHSMESRPPFLDHHLAAFAVRIPPGLRIRRGVEKWVLREAMKGLLPEVLYKRQKFAFMAPPGNTDAKQRAALKSLIEKRLQPDQLNALGVFDAGQVNAFLERYWVETNPEQARRNDILVNHLLGLHILHQDLVH